MARRSTPKGFAESKTQYRAPRVGDKWPDDIARDKSKAKLPPPETLPDGTVRYFLVAGAKGRVLLPADMRAAMGLEEGDVITAWLKDGEVRLHSHLHGLRRVQAEASSIAKGSVDASDELIAERRAEAAKEDEAALMWLRQTKKKKR